jgi:hypothetical protein
LTDLPAGNSMDVPEVTGSMHHLVRRTTQAVSFLLSAISLLMLVVLSGCATLGFGSRMDSEKHRDIAVLVVRVGNVFPIAPMEQVDLQTDFSLRVPDGHTNVFVETEQRLLGSFPGYPAYPEIHGGWQANFYGNISAEIESNISDFFTDSGYRVVNVRPILESANPHYSELTVRQIVSLMTGSVDALLVLEYFDKADTHNIQSAGNNAFEVSGFAGALLTYTMFDTENGNTLFSNTPFVGFFFPVALTSDRAIRSDESIQSKVTVAVEEMESSTRTTVTHSLTESEIVGIFTSKIIYGLDPEGESPFKDLNAQAYHMRGLVDYVPALF